MTNPIGALLPAPRQQFLDANGNPLVGGAVWTYVPNSQTLKTTWQDPLGTSPNQNPVPLDGAGSATIYGSGQYELVVRDANGNVIPNCTGLSQDSLSLVTNGPLDITNGLTVNGGDITNTGNFNNTGTFGQVGAVNITGDQAVSGDQTIGGNQGVSENQTITGSQKIGGNLEFDGLLSGTGPTDGISRVLIVGLGTANTTNGLRVLNLSGITGLQVGDGGTVSSPSTVNNTSGSAANLYMDGGGNLFLSTSSRRYKRAIRRVVGALDAVRRLRLVRFKSRIEPGDDRDMMGLVAEEVHAAGLVELVEYDIRGRPNGVQYGAIGALAAGAVRELEVRVARAERDIERLRDALRGLKARPR